MDHDDWRQRWQEGQTPFHLDQVNPWLLKFQDHLLLDRGKRILVPLCGKSLDMAHLAGLGAHVTGVELAPEALQAFAAEQNLELQRASSRGLDTLTSPSFSLLTADFLTLSSRDLGLFDAIWDRAALIALPRATRPAYARQLGALLKPGGRLLLVNLEYDQALMEGPPYSVPLAEVEALFSHMGTLEVLAAKEISLASTLRQNHDFPSLKERVFLITQTAPQE